MNCEDTRKRILDLDNQFEPAAEEAVAAHLAGCPACREFHAEIQRTWDALGRLPELEASPGFHQAVWAKIRAREGRQPGRVLTLTFLPPSLRAAAWAAVVVMAVTAGFVIFQAVRPAPPAPAVAVTETDRQDDEMLMELDALINYDESQMFGAYQDWNVSGEGKEQRPEIQSKPKPEPKPDAPRLNLVPNQQTGRIQPA
jgi:anti-sigma factor RsiW